MNMGNGDHLRRRELLQRGSALLTTFGIPGVAHADPTQQPGNGRQMVWLDGMWDVGESLGPRVRPANFNHRTPVPGLTHSATPPFPNVDDFESREYIQMQVTSRRMPPSARISTNGRANQPRNYFWYRTYFDAPATRERALLTVHKARYGFEVWVNGRSMGSHLCSNTSASFDVTGAVRWSSRNEVLIRIGAHPGVLPEGNPWFLIGDGRWWPPGIYDRVSIAFTDALSIQSTQIAPKISPREILVQTVLHNSGKQDRSVPLEMAVIPWKGSSPIATVNQTAVVPAGRTLELTARIPLPDAELWSPEDPNLYVLRHRIPGDEVSTRFGIRELRFDTPTRRSYLNGKVYFLRGSSIWPNRFYMNAESGLLPWDDDWVRQLFVQVKEMHWNFMRMCLSAPPQRWLDIADEEGILLQYEYPINVKTPALRGVPLANFDVNELIGDFKRWMQDAWNHPSVAMWDASNESVLPVLATTVVPAVRGLDLSGRQWENSWNPPDGPDDPVEAHPYEFLDPHFEMTRLELANGAERAEGSLVGPVPTGHTGILNEYGWLWLDRKGDPTGFTAKVYEKLPYPHSTAAERLETYAYLLAGLTEYWRAFRYYSAVMYYGYLTTPEGNSPDNFKDYKTLELQPLFKSWVGEAFKPLGVYINFWQRQLKGGETREFQIMMINDHAVENRGTLAVVLEDLQGQVVSRTALAYYVVPSGQQTLYARLPIPGAKGEYWLKAIATPSGKEQGSTTSRRKVALI